MRSTPWPFPRSKCTSRTFTRAKRFVRFRSRQRLASARSADSVHKATTWDWTQPSHVWKLRLAMAARKGKNGDDGGASAVEHDPLVTMARGLAEVVAEHNLSELILDTK